ncbi:GNAT family N-acetyltransferase [Rhodopseudomonas sp.]|uniref:GNAT family N-acetyltransferase n=1 Tax=Rhodopseudomonas sp. TaxID=1078 RepID=UPI0039E4B043
MKSSVIHWVVSEVKDFDFLSEEYRSLFSRSGASPFQSPLWLARLYAELVLERAARPFIITIRDGLSRRLIGVIPLAIHRHLGISVAVFADHGVSDYCSIVATTEDLESFRHDDALTSQLRRALRKCDLLIVRKVQAPALATFDVLGEVSRRPLGINAHATALGRSFDDWRERAMPRSLRRSLDKKRRSMGRKGHLKTQAIEDPDLIIAALHQILEFRKFRFKGHDKRDLLDEERYFRFYCEVARDPMFRTYVMTLDDRPVSIAYGASWNDRFHLLLTGFDYLNYRNASLGLLVIEDAIKDCISRGDAEFDLTIGDQPYKRHFGTVETPMWSVLCGFSVVGCALSFLLSHSPRVLSLARRLVR